MQPLTRHGHRGHAVFVLPARPRRAAGTGRQPHPPCEKRAPPRRAPIAPPAAPPQKSLANHTPRHAAGRPRTAKARAVWQPHRAPPRRENSPVSRTPHAAHHLPVCRVAKNAWASRHAVRTAPPRHENSPVSRTPHAAHHRPACRACRCAHRSRRARCARRRPAAGRQSARRMAATPRPSPPQNTPVGRAPRPIAPPAAPPRKVRPNTRPDAPRPKARPPAVRAGARFLFVRFVPSSSMSRSAQSQRQAPHDRRSRSAAACQAARGRMNHSA